MCTNQHTLSAWHNHVFMIHVLELPRLPSNATDMKVFTMIMPLKSTEDMFHIKNINFVCPFNLLWVFVDGKDVCCSDPCTEVFWGGFSRDTLFCFEPAVDLHSHPVEAAGTLVDDTEAAVAMVAQSRRRAAQAAVVANSILKLVDLGDLGLQFPLEMM